MIKINNHLKDKKYVYRLRTPNTELSEIFISEILFRISAEKSANIHPDPGM